MGGTRLCASRQFLEAAPYTESISWSSRVLVTYRLMCENEGYGNTVPSYQLDLVAKFGDLNRVRVILCLEIYISLRGI